MQVDIKKVTIENSYVRSNIARPIINVIIKQKMSHKHAFHPRSAKAFSCKISLSSMYLTLCAIYEQKDIVIRCVILKGLS